MARITNSLDLLVTNGAAASASSATACAQLFIIIPFPLHRHAVRLPVGLLLAPVVYAPGGVPLRPLRLIVDVSRSARPPAESTLSSSSTKPLALRPRPHLLSFSMASFFRVVSSRPSETPTPSQHILWSQISKPSETPRASQHIQWTQNSQILSGPTPVNLVDRPMALASQFSLPSLPSQLSQHPTTREDTQVSFIQGDSQPPTESQTQKVTLIQLPSVSQATTNGTTFYEVSSQGSSLSQEQKDKIWVKKKLAIEQLKRKHPQKARAAINREKAIETRRTKIYQKERTAKSR